MKRRSLMLLLALVTVVALLTGSVSVAFSQAPVPMHKMVTIHANSRADVQKLAQMGIDIAKVRPGPIVEGPRGVPTQSYTVEAVVTNRDAAKLNSAGFRWAEVPGKGPAKKIGEPYVVYHSYDEPVSGIQAQLRKLSATYPKLAKLHEIGKSVQGRPLLVLSLANERIKGAKPQVLFLATHHAREWAATETAMRLAKYLLAQYGRDKRVTKLLDTTEVWVMPVANPDGYQFTFTTDRLWRRNLRDNDGDGQITIADGVDLNRNFDAHWGYDNEGSSGDPANDTYRGPSPASEPETQAVVNLVQREHFKFILSYHTYGDLILYPWGWQVQTPSLDDPIFVAQAGTDANPAVYDTLAGHGYDPGVGADLYTTNGEFTDWAYDSEGIPAQTIELTDGSGYGFVFPDDEAMVQQTFVDNLPFALAYAESAADPAHPVSPVGIQTEDAYHTPLTTSTGAEQAVTVLARKGLALQLTYSINGGPQQTAAFAEKLGTVYNDKSGTFYSRYQALITGQQAGDGISYTISAGAGVLGPYSYTVASATGNPILVVAAEDYTGAYPTYPPGGPFYLSYYTAALDAAGKAYDVWDVDARAAVATEPEVLSHYRAAIWYTGDDYAATVPSGLATSGIEVLNFRDWLNYDGGKLLATGQDLSAPATSYGFYPNDFYQYYLGAYIGVDGGGLDANGQPLDVQGVAGDPVLDGLAFSLQGPGSANNQAYPDTFLTTSYFVPHFGDRLAARYVRPGGPFDPHSGDYDVYSQMADYSFKRLSRTFTVPAAPAALKFWISADTEPDWDFAFVEINEVGTDTWTTLPDVNGLTSTTTGLSCASGWVQEIHPFLAHYMDANCAPSGTTGSWNAFTGNSGGWQQMEMDLSAYAGKTVEVDISYASDWGTQGLGVWVDDIEVPGQAIESFETGLGDWTVTVAPGSPVANNWVRAAKGALPEGPALRTPNSLYFGFGFEGIASETTRSELMQKTMSYFGQ